MERNGIPVRVHGIVYARHVENPELVAGGMNISALSILASSSKPKGL